MKIVKALAVAALFLFGGCKTTMEANKKTTTGLRYLALGDSYTIGESVPAEGSFPYQLAVILSKRGHATAQPEIIATTGWTTGELIEAISHSDTNRKQYDLVTLLIGVNNQYRGQSQDVYRIEFVQLLNTAIKYAGGDKSLVFVVSIPDWGVTPFAEGRDRAQIAKEIDQFNTINKQEAGKAGVAYINITPVSKQAGTDATLNADDGLHPSAKMYGLWVKEIAPVVVRQIK